MTLRSGSVLGMALRTLVAGVVLIGVTALVTSRGVSDDKPGDKPMSQQQAAEMEMQKKFMEAATPGPHHKHLEALVGEWNAETKFWMGPGEPATGKATSSYRWIMDGRFLQHEYKSEWQGQPFSGMGLLGYDNLQKKYTGTWIDSMSTSIYTHLGVCDESGKTITLDGEGPDPMTGKMKKGRSIYKIISKDKHVFEMYEIGEDGKMQKNMEITYTRK